MSPEEFTGLYRQYLPQISKYLVRRCERDQVEDLASKIFEIAWQKRDNAPEGHELPWLYRIAGYVLANHRRTQGVAASFLASISQVPISPSPEEIAIADLSLAEAWKTLSPAERHVLSLASFDGLSGSQLAVALGISENAANIRLLRARNKLARALVQNS